MSIESTPNNNERIEDDGKAEMMARATDRFHTQATEAEHNADRWENLAAQIHDSVEEMEKLSDEELQARLVNLREAQQEAADLYNYGLNDEPINKFDGITSIADEFEYWRLKRELAEKILKDRNVPIPNTMPPYLLVSRKPGQPFKRG